MSQFPCFTSIPNTAITAMETAANTLISSMAPYAPDIPANLRRRLNPLSLTDQSKEFVEQGLEIAKMNQDIQAPTLDVPL